MFIAMMKHVLHKVMSSMMNKLRISGLFVDRIQHINFQAILV